MKLPLIPLLVLAVCLSGVLGCGQASNDATATAANDEALLGLLPENATGVFYVDLQKAWNIPAARRKLAENVEADEFMTDTGIDVTRDIHGVAVAVTNRDGQAVMVLNAKFDKDVLIGKIKEKEGTEIIEEIYEGIPVFETTSVWNKEETASMAFLDDARVAVGNPADVRSVIDVYQKRARSMLENPELMNSVESANRDGVLWAAFVFSQGDVESLTKGNPMLGRLGSLQSLIMGVDYREETIHCEIECASGTPEQNQQVFDMLNGIKSFAAMGAAENPRMAEMLRGIEITSDPEKVRIVAAIPEALFMEAKEEGD